MSTNYNTKKWIERVISSCTSNDQILTTKNLIVNFKNKMRKEGYDELLMIPFITDLEYKLEQKGKLFNL